MKEKNLRPWRFFFCVPPLPFCWLPPPFSFFSPPPLGEGSYDPLWGRTAEEACRLLVDAAVGTGLSPGEAAALTLPLRDELDYLSRRDGTLSLGAFARASARELGEAAFAQGDGRLAESHSAPEVSAKLDWLRLHLRTGCPPAPGRPLGAALRPGAVTLLGLPQGEAAWAALALSELRGLGSVGRAGILTVFCELHLDGACRAQVEGLPCGRLFCYQDLPALGWMWQAATDACQAGCVLCHWGESAQVLSAYFGRVLREKPVASRTTSFGQCDSGGPMGLFRTRTVTTSEGYSGSYLWEPEVPEEVIRGLGENEGILFSQNRLEGFRIPSECTG